MIGTAAEDALPYVYLLIAVCTLTGFAYGAIKWARSQLKSVVLEDVAPALAHIHDCLERTAREGTEERAAWAAEGTEERAEIRRVAADTRREAVAAATKASTEATLAREAAEDAARIMQEHTDLDKIRFDEITDWRARTDMALRNIQQAQTEERTQ